LKAAIGGLNGSLNGDALPREQRESLGRREIAEGEKERKKREKE